MLEEIAGLSCELNEFLQKFDNRKKPTLQRQLDSLKKSLEKGNGKIYCFLEGKKPVGFVSVFPDRSPGSFYLEEVVVHEQFRGKGIGSKLFEKHTEDFKGKQLLVTPWRKTSMRLNSTKNSVFKKAI